MRLVSPPGCWLAMVVGGWLIAVSPGPALDRRESARCFCTRVVPRAVAWPLAWGSWGERSGFSASRSAIAGACGAHEGHGLDSAVVTTGALDRQGCASREDGRRAAWAARRS